MSQLGAGGFGSFFFGEAPCGGAVIPSASEPDRASGHAFDADSWLPRRTVVDEIVLVRPPVVEIPAPVLITAARLLCKSQLQIQLEEEDELLLVGIL